MNNRKFKTSCGTLDGELIQVINERLLQEHVRGKLRLSYCSVRSRRDPQYFISFCLLSKIRMVFLRSSCQFSWIIKIKIAFQSVLIVSLERISSKRIWKYVYLFKKMFLSLDFFSFSIKHDVKLESKKFHQMFFSKFSEKQDL